MMNRSKIREVTMNRFFDFSAAENMTPIKCFNTTELFYRDKETLLCKKEKKTKLRAAGVLLEKIICSQKMDFINCRTYTD